jgi:peptidyl-prolyl cis-trans isomerase C
MSTPAASSPAPSRRRDPLWGFFAVAALIYAITVASGGAEDFPDESEGAPAGPSGTIVVDEAVRAAIDAGLVAQLGRAPTEAERASALRHWVDQEVLVREALLLGLERADPVVRARLAERMAFVAGATSGEPDAPSEADLRALYEASLAEYVVPGALTVEQLYFGAGADAAERRQRAQRALEAGASPDDIEGTLPPPGGPTLRGRRTERLAETHGPELAAAAAAAPEGAWVATPSAHGEHLVRVVSRRAERTLAFEEVRDRLAARWQRERTALATERALRELRGRYVVEGLP